jgi:hypothetical protein
MDRSAYPALGPARRQPRSTGFTAAWLTKIRPALVGPMSRLNDFLDRYVLPWPVRFLTFRFVILVTIGLLIPLIVFANNTVLVLGINSYLNTMSVAVSSIVLLYTTIAEIRQKQIAEMQEKRAQEDHEHVTQMHTLLLQMLASQNEEIDELKQRLAQMQGESYTPEAPLPLPDLRVLHPRGYKRFATNDPARRWQKQVIQNPLTAAIQKNLVKRQS